VERLGARIVWVSVSTVTDEPTIERDLAHLVETAVSRNAHVMVGGRAMSHVPASAAPNRYVGSPMAELAALARGLRASAAR
jgi:hypothetical protein